MYDEVERVEAQREFDSETVVRVLREWLRCRQYEDSNKNNMIVPYIPPSPSAGEMPVKVLENRQLGWLSNLLDTQ